ncbi:MAG TPA: hypothetical protein HA218_01925 [Nanoarchaeota archaeon]|nr:hypothetical protein [Nanoarchaeota archaeon]
MWENNMDKKELVSKFVDKGFLLAPEMAVVLERENPERIFKFLELVEKQSIRPLILTDSFFISLIGEQERSESREMHGLDEPYEPQAKRQTVLEVQPLKVEIGQKLEESVEARIEQKVEISLEGQGKKDEGEDVFKSSLKSPNGVRVIYTHVDQPRKIHVEDFVVYFRNRFLRLRDLIVSRPELEKITSVNKIGSQKEEFSVIGMVQEKRTTKNGNFFLAVEDLTGVQNIIVSSKNQELFERAENLAYDEVIGVRGWGNNVFLFANDIIQPEFYGKERKQGGKGYALFLSDIHIGSNKFMEKEFKNFLRWLNLEVEGKNKEIAEKCRYLFILGDVADGIGVYPGQEKELAITDLQEQYDQAAYLLSQVRDDIKIIMIPGNHDATRDAQPQPIFDEKYASALYKLKNTIILSNPSSVNIGADEKFEGYNVMLYHGHSLNYYANNIPALVNKGYKNPELLLSYLFKRRHLAPTHGSTPYIPLERDPFLIEKVPDIVAMGELHKLSTTYNNNVAFINCSTWQARTSYQVKVGHEPDPAKVPAFDLAKNTIRILDFA